MMVALSVLTALLIANLYILKDKETALKKVSVLKSVTVAVKTSVEPASSLTDRSTKVQSKYLANVAIPRIHVGAKTRTERKRIVRSMPYLK